MESKRIKGSIDTVKADIRPYLKKAFLHKAYLDASDVTPVCRFIRNKYSNVEITPRPGADGKPYLVVNVHRFLTGGRIFLRDQGGWKVHSYPQSERPVVMD